ncbi:MAG: hypothetical protein WCC11_03520 [Gammaproteobacteria bacterium]
MIRSLACIVVVTLCMGACSGAHDNKDYTGILYFSWGQTLYAMNLQDRNVVPVYKNPEMVMTSLDKLDDQHLLLGYESLVRGSFGMTGELIVDRLNGSVMPYGGAMQRRSLRYLPQLKVVVFFGLVGGADSSHWSLYWANVDTPLQSHLIDDTGTAGSIIVVSDHQVVYTVGILGGNFRLKTYDFETHRSSFLSIANCRPTVWRSRTDQLVCNNAGNYYLARLDGLGKERIHFGILNSGLAMVAYVNEYDSAIMTGYGGIWFSFRRGFYEVSDLYLYDFKTKILTSLSNRYAADANLGTAVWYPSSSDKTNRTDGVNTMASKVATN